MVEPAATVPATADVLHYTAVGDLAAVRRFVRERAVALGLPAERTDPLLLAVSELATNTLRHSSGGGWVRVWADAGAIVCEVHDGGPPRQFGRTMPAADAESGRGLAIVERICDEVSSRSGPAGSLVQLRFLR